MHMRMPCYPLQWSDDVGRHHRGSGYATRKTNKQLDDKMIPLMGSGRFHLCAQMINFTIPVRFERHLGVA